MSDLPLVELIVNGRGLGARRVSTVPRVGERVAADGKIGHVTQVTTWFSDWKESAFPHHRVVVEVNSRRG
jgi:hypothetical protein